MAKFVYLIASHKNPAQIERLVNVISSGSPEAMIMIHHDSSSCTLDYKKLLSIPNVKMIEKTIRVKWGDFSQIEMVLHCLRCIIDEVPDVKWVIFLSGQDYPLKPINKIQKEIDESDYDAFMTYFSLKTGDAIARKNINERYYYRYYILPRHWRISRFLNYIENVNYKLTNLKIFPGLRNANPRLGVKRKKTIFNDDFICYKGQFWMTLGRKSLMYILSFVQKHPEVANYYKRSLNPDESFFQTILVNNSGLHICNDHMRYIDWSDRNLSHPKLLDSLDYDKMLASGKHFARKFDMLRDVNILDMLDQRIRFKLA